MSKTGENFKEVTEYVSETLQIGRIYHIHLSISYFLTLKNFLEKFDLKGLLKFLQTARKFIIDNIEEDDTNTVKWNRHLACLWSEMSTF